VRGKAAKVAIRSIRPMCRDRLSPIMASMATTLSPTTQVRRSTPDVNLRLARRDESAAVERLAELDSARAPEGRVLVAEVQGELWAALSLEDFHAVADPFRPTEELVLLLVERGRQLRRWRVAA